MQRYLTEASITESTVTLPPNLCVEIAPEARCVRSNLKTWCGYVKFDSTARAAPALVVAYAICYNHAFSHTFDPLSVHGDVTLCRAENGTTTLGFDTSHIGDWSPAPLMSVILRDGTYRDLEFARAQCVRLAQSLDALIKRTSRCRHCRAEKAAHRCSKCHLAFYCSVECQTAAWPTHRSQCAGECRALAISLKTTPLPSIEIARAVQSVAKRLL